MNWLEAVYGKCVQWFCGKKNIVRFSSFWPNFPKGTATAHISRAQEIDRQSNERTDGQTRRKEYDRRCNEKCLPSIEPMYTYTMVINVVNNRRAVIVCTEMLVHNLVSFWSACKKGQKIFNYNFSIWENPDYLHTAISMGWKKNGQKCEKTFSWGMRRGDGKRTKEICEWAGGWQWDERMANIIICTLFKLAFISCVLRNPHTLDSIPMKHELTRTFTSKLVTTLDVGVFNLFMSVL